MTHNAAVTAAEDALYATNDVFSTPAVARVAVAAARPIIETEVRERIAAEVRAWCHEERHGQAVEGDRWITVLCGDCEELAARIARGQS